jgi:biotin synthase-like enzyme
MITRIRTFTVTAGKAPEAISLLKEIAQAAARVHNRTPSEIAVTLGGDLSEVSMIMRGDGVDSHDEIIAKSSAHPEIAPLLTRLFPLLTSATEKVYRHV